MFILYNIFQLLFIILFFPFILILVFSNKKLRSRIPQRLGLGLNRQRFKKVSKAGSTFWIHALSVGEVTSAHPLINGIKIKYPDSRIVLSVTTTTGKEVARKILGSTVDHIIDSPIDLLPVVYHYYRKIKPDLFILIETDFWPNILYFLKILRTPILLVNGRVSKQSMVNYSRFRLFFKPMFQNFSSLCMQTELDKKNMLNLGITPERLFTPGNLKFDTHLEEENVKINQSLAALLPANKTIFIAGSTHKGEEEILIAVYADLLEIHKNLYLILVPRNPKRSPEIQMAAEKTSMRVRLRSSAQVEPSDILIVNTIGELTHFYALADIAFIGGSLVNKGGHNPIEPAAHSLPVMFGPHMQDFSEIANEMIRSGGAIEVTNQQSLYNHTDKLLRNNKYRAQLGNDAFQYVHNQHGVVARHLDIIDALL